MGKGGAYGVLLDELKQVMEEGDSIKILCTYTHIHMQKTCIYMHIHVYVYTCIDICRNLHVYTYICIYICVCISLHTMSERM